MSFFVQDVFCQNKFRIGSDRINPGYFQFRQDKIRPFPNFHINIFIQKTPEYLP